jgi:threonyl-tRNA synthetase
LANACGHCKTRFRFVEAGLRAEISGPDRGTLGARVRSRRLAPYQAVIGARESADDTVSLRLQTGLALDPMPAQEAVDHIVAAADPLRQLTRSPG